jgi:2-polyprenyl-6-methoxyphenol hydroxylase-like FAD-dependent oxidoreductase
MAPTTKLIVSADGIKSEVRKWRGVSTTAFANEVLKRLRSLARSHTAGWCR